MEKKLTNPNITRFIIPLSTNFNQKELKKFVKEHLFEKKDYYSRYLQASIYNMFLNHVEMYILSLDGFAKANVSKDSIVMKSTIRRNKKNTPIEETFSFEIASIALYAFKTGIMFLSLEVKYPFDTSDEKITDFNFAFSRMLKSSCRDKVKFYNSTNDEFDLAKTVLSLLPDKKGCELKCEQLPAYHVIGREINRENSKKDLRLFEKLINGLHSEALDKKADTNSFSFEPNQGIYWMGGPFGLLSYYEYVDRKGFVFTRDAHSNNVKFDYFMLYLMNLHEKIYLEDLNTKIVLNCESTSAIIALQKKLLEGKVLYSHKNVSFEANYQLLYEKLISQSKVNETADEIEKLLSMVDDYESGKRNRRLNAVSMLLAFFGIVGIADNTINLFSHSTLSIAQISALSLEGAALIVLIIYVTKIKRM